MLYLIPTPIGNLEDITLRAIRILREVDLILAEDTRTSRKLLDHHGIDTPLRAHHAHNEHAAINGVLRDLEIGRKLALVSDAGTPGISDPGFLLVRECLKAGIEVQCLPGPTAIVPALVQSGLPCDRFHFEGFLPHKKGRQTRLKYLASLPNTFALYESPHRLVKCMEQLQEFCGSDRAVCVQRELSKLHEEAHRGSIAEVLAFFKGRADKVRGEIVIVVAGLGKENSREEEED
jgi:16S rRNA (cytidine1402-2'-O)-methyltransferase